MTTNDGSGRSVFARYIVDSPPEAKQRGSTLPRGPLLQPIVPPSDYKSHPVERLLDWLVNRWGKPTVSARDIQRFGPNPIRDRNSANAMAEILVEHGWLAPLKTHRYDRREWQIVRGTSK
jgi:hypothetical protein